MTRIALIDDQREGLQGLSLLIKQYEKKREYIEFEIQQFQQPDVFLKSYIKDRYDIIFIDIGMKPISGIDLSKKIRLVDKKVFLVFATGDSSNRAKAFDVHAFDYLVKPLQKDAIIRLLDDYYSHLNEMEYASSETIAYSNRIKDLNIKLDSILYIEQRSNKSVIHTKYNIVEVYDTLKNLLPLLPDHFTMCHRSFIVNINAIERREATQCIMNNNQMIPIGRRNGKTFRATYMNYLASSRNSRIFKQ